MKKLLPYIFIFIVFGETKAQFSDLRIKLHDEKVLVKSLIEKLYIVLRANAAKSSIIAKKFNYSDTINTHVGLGFFDNGVFKIYNISNTKKNNRYVFFDSLDEYISDSSCFNISVWYTYLTSEEIKTGLQEMKNIYTLNPFFDYDFKLLNGNKYYCSELCVDILQKINKDRYNFKPANTEIKDKFIYNFLERNTLTYFPVDFFISNKEIHFFGSYKLK